MSNDPVKLVKDPERQRGHSAGVIITAEIPVVDGKLAPAIQKANSRDLKNEVYDRRAEFGLTNHGIQTSGSFEPIKDASGKVVKYIIDFKFTAGI